MKITLKDSIGNTHEVEARDLVDDRKQSESMTFLRQVAKETGWLNYRETVVTDPDTGVVIAQQMGRVPGIGAVIMDIPSVEDLKSEESIDFYKRLGMTDEDIDNLFDDLD